MVLTLNDFACFYGRRIIQSFGAEGTEGTEGQKKFFACGALSCVLPSYGGVAGAAPPHRICSLGADFLAFGNGQTKSNDRDSTN